MDAGGGEEGLGSGGNLGHRGPQNFEVRKKVEGIIGIGRRVLGKDVVRYYNHIPAGSIRDNVGAQTFDSYQKFCVVRNPWDRAVSLYFWRKNRPDANRLGKETSFADFIRETSPDILSDFEDASVRNTNFFRNLQNLNHAFFAIDFKSIFFFF